jgi:hypothetical protein
MREMRGGWLGNIMEQEDKPATFEQREDEISGKKTLGRDFQYAGSRHKREWVPPGPYNPYRSRPFQESAAGTGAILSNAKPSHTLIGTKPSLV